MSTIRDDSLLIRLTEIGLSRKWHLVEAKWGRGGTSSLLAHSLTVAGLTKDLMEIIGGFSDNDKKVGIAASFFHDMLKEGSSSHKIIEERGKLLDKLFCEDSNKVIRGILREVGLSNEEIEQVIFILPYGAIQGTEHLNILLQDRENHDNPKVRRLVHNLSDPLASIKNIDDFSNLTIIKEPLKEFGLNLKYHKIAVVRGVLSSILHKTMHQIYENAGYKPVLFYPKGTVYIGTNGCKEPDFSPFNTLYWNNLQEFLNGISEIRQLGYEAIGRINASAIKAPRFVYINDKTINEFWDAAKNQSVIREPKIDDEYKKIDIPLQKTLDNEVFEEYLKERVGLYYLFLYLKAVLEHATNNWEDDKAIDILNNILNIELQDTPLTTEEFLNLLKSLSHNKPKKIKIEKGSVIKSIFIHCFSREETLEAALKFCKRVSIKVRPCADQHYGLKSIDIPGQMLDEVAYPLIGNATGIIKNVWESYTHGKERGTPLCVLCGRKSSHDAIADLLGKSQTFTNFLCGGTGISVGNKLRVCDLCDMEMSIRTLFTKTSDFEEYYLVPQINLSQSATELWFENAAKLVDDQKILGINPISRDLTWAKIIIDREDIAIFDKISNTLNEYTSYLLTDLWKNEKKTIAESIKSSIEDIIKKEYGGVFEIFARENGLKDKNINELLKSILSGNAETLWIIGDYLEEINKSNIKSLLAMITPNYALVSYPLIKKELEDDRASNYLRHLFRGAILSRLFLSSVIVKELRYEPLIDIISHGSVKIPTNLQLDRVFQNMGFKLDNGWLKIDDIDKALIKLSSLILLVEDLRPLGSKGRKSEMITVLGDIPGRTLNRLMQESQDTKHLNIKRDVRLINIIFNNEVMT